MSDSSKPKDENFGSPHPGINQESRGSLGGGQQAAYGNHNNQYQDNRKTDVNINNFNINIDSYSLLEDRDLEPLSFWGRISNYLTVFCFLLFTFVFWTVFGLFTTFPFPREQVGVLIFSCFRGTLFSKINGLQKKWQREVSTAASAEELNNLDFQGRLYLKVLENLGSESVISREKLAQTIETIKLKKQKIEIDLQSLQGSRYKNVLHFQDQFESILATKAEKDLARIDEILGNLALSMKYKESSDKILQDLIQEISKEIKDNIESISPSRLGILYKIGFLFQELSSKDISRLDASELAEFTKNVIKGLREKKRELEEELNALQAGNEFAQRTIQSYSARLSDLQNSLDQKGQNFQLQKNDFLKRINELTQKIKQKDAEIDQLENELEKH